MNNFIEIYEDSLNNDLCNLLINQFELFDKFNLTDVGVSGTIGVNKDVKDGTRVKGVPAKKF